METFLFVVGYIVQLIASALLLLKMNQTKSSDGISIDTQLAFVLATVVRCIWTLETRLIETWFAYGELIGSTVLGLLVAHACWRFRDPDARHSRPIWMLQLQILAPLALVLAFFLHPSTDWFSMQVLVSFTMFMEAIGVMPQVFLMSKVQIIDAMGNEYVGLLAVARLIRLVFWTVLYFKGEHFFTLMVADGLHTLITIECLRLWFKKLSGKLYFSI